MQKEREMAAKGKQKPDIERLERPQGEGGSRKKGFKIKEAMGLKNNTALYNDILVSPLGTHLDMRVFTNIFAGHHS